MKSLYFLDTNILLYSISLNPDEASKRLQSRRLLDSEDVALSVQVLQEFYTQATRSSRSDALSGEAAALLVESWTRFKVQEISTAILFDAIEISAAHGFSYWDSAIIAAARSLGCDILYSEDMQHGREVDGVRIVNPFRER